jgi:hypothetical protein
MGENISSQKFIKSEDGNHFYMKRDEDWLHVVIYRKDGEYIQNFENGYYTSEYKKGEALINNIYGLNPKKGYLPSTEQEFKEAMFDAIFVLDIFQYAVSKK